jgi:predicted RND superfamily exporter protein
MLGLARAALARPFLVLALLAVATAAVARGLFRLELRTDGAAIYPRDDPAVERTLADRQAFAEVDQIVLLVTSRPGGPRLDSAAGCRFLVRLQHALARFPGVELAGVRSAVTLIDPPESLEPLRIRTFFEEWTGGEAGLADVLARMRRLPVTGGLFLSAGGTAAAFYVPVGDRITRTELLADLRRFLVTRAGAPFRLRLTGPVAAEVDLGEEVVRDLARLVPIMVAAVALLLGLTLRTVGGVLIPLAQVVATLVWTLGLMGWAGVPITLVTTVLPVLLMAMAMTDEIYLLERLQDHLAGLPPAGGRQPVRLAAERAFADLVAPLVLISLATAAGFFSFLGAAMAPLRHLGLFTGAGLLLGMLFTFTLAPALMAALPASWLERRRGPVGDGGSGGGAGGSGDGGGGRGGRGGGLLPFERWTARRSRAVALGAVVLLAVAVPGLPRLRVEDSWIDNFDPRSPLVTAARRFDAEFWGSYRFDVVCTGRAGTFWAPPGVAMLEELQRWAGRAPNVGGMVSVLPIFEAGAWALGCGRPLSALPARDLRRVGMLTEVLRLRLYLRDLLTLDAGRMRARLLVRHADYGKARRLADAFAAELPRLVNAGPGGPGRPGRPGGPIEVHASGEVPEALAVVAAIVGNQLRSIGWTAVLIAAMLLAALRSLRWTAVVMAPVLGATLLLFAGLGYAGVPLGIATSMFAALNLGAGVDFAVQYVYAYRRERRAGLDHAAAVKATLATTGRGLRWNALVLALGIAVLTLSSIKPNQSLGMLLALAILVSYASTLALLPELLRRVAPWGGPASSPPRSNRPAGSESRLPVARSAHHYW